MNRRLSLKYLLGAGIAGIGLSALYKYVGKGNLDLNMLQEKKEMIAELAEMIIPRTDTPGAKDAGAEVFIINMITEASDRKIQQNFIQGLVDMEQYAFNYYHREFMDCDPLARFQILTYFENSSGYSNVILNKINNKLFGTPFFLKLKALTVEGYCTSEIGAKQGLAYDYIPGAYNACIPLTKNQKSWATK